MTLQGPEVRAVLRVMVRVWFQRLGPMWGSGSDIIGIMLSNYTLVIVRCTNSLYIPG